MKRKSDIVREAVAAGNFKEALRIAKGFRINITAEQRDTMCRAYAVSYTHLTLPTIA